MPCGPDGLFVNLAQYVQDQLVLGVNPDPATIAGTLMPFVPKQVGLLIRLLQREAGAPRTEALPFVKGVIDNDRVVWGINDLFIGRRDHVSARYEIAFEGESEHQSSSGVIVSTGVGATGWLRSILTMVDALAEGGARHLWRLLPQRTESTLMFVVREPFPSPTTDTGIVTGTIQPGSPLTLTCEMAKGGVIFSDGITERATEWGAGSKVEITVGDRFIRRVVG